MTIITVQQMRDLDQRTILEYNTLAITLMLRVVIDVIKVVGTGLVPAH